MSTEYFPTNKFTKNQRTLETALIELVLFAEKKRWDD